MRRIFAAMPVSNRFTQIARRYAWLPAPLRRPLVSFAVGRTIPFVKTTGLAIEAYTPTRVAARLRNRRRVQNHVGSPHAAAMALLAETVTGLVVALNVPAGCVPVLRTLQVDYRRRPEGALHAFAALSPEEARRIQSKPIGKVDVTAEVTDAAGHAPLACTLQWAWLPRDRFG